MAQMERIVFPKYPTCHLCRNLMNQVCIEECVAADDYRWFDFKPTPFVDLPALPKDIHKWPGKIKGIVYAVYLSKMVDFLQGKEEVYERPTYSQRSLNLLAALKVASLSDAEEKADPAPPVK